MKTLIGATGILFAAMTGVAQAETLPVYGAWDCEIMDFTLDAKSYVVSGQKLKVKTIEKILDDAYGIEMTDGYRVSLFDVRSKSLTWHSPESGDMFECRRK